MSIFRLQKSYGTNNKVQGAGALTLILGIVHVTYDLRNL